MTNFARTDPQRDINYHTAATAASPPAPPAFPAEPIKNDMSFCSKVVKIFLIPLLLIGGTIIAIMYFTGWGGGLISKSGFIFEKDGWEGVQIEDMPKWNTRGSGILQIEMINTLDEHWQSYFQQSLSEWNSGIPKILELTETRITDDDNTQYKDCDFVIGKFIVCNDNYGDTSFHGVNELLVKDGTITASAAKMNEYYMEQLTTTEARKQYTMCHGMLPSL